jgi:hypothetical protein
MTLITRHSSFIILALFCLSGCGGKLESSISGLVTVDGEPLRTGRVVFYSVNGDTVAYGVIDSNGRYRISTGTTAGLKAGDYVVTVVATEVPPGPIGSSYGKLISPAQYASKEKTTLKFTVQPGENHIDLPLQTAPQ